MSNEPHPVIYNDPALTPPHGEYWTTPDMIKSGRPTFVPDYVAKVFFGMSASWIRQHLSNGYEIDGVRFEPSRSPGGLRAFTLHDVERWAHLLARQKVITGQQLGQAVTVVRDIARVHRFIP